MQNNVEQLNQAADRVVNANEPE